ncbi:MAG TPA: hypothetical protein VLF20_01340 [Patescibacteria group bacterium]|nr:hypothetical protein [Patescibacteria group bacterium]
MNKDKAPRSLPRVFISELLGNGARRRAIVKGEDFGNHPIQNALTGVTAQGSNILFPALVRAFNLDDYGDYASRQTRADRNNVAMATVFSKIMFPLLIPEYIPGIPAEAGIPIFASILAAEHLIVAGIRTKETREMERSTGRRWPQ